MFSKLRFGILSYLEIILDNQKTSFNLTEYNFKVFKIPKRFWKIFLSRKAHIKTCYSLPFNTYYNKLCLNCS